MSDEKNKFSCKLYEIEDTVVFSGESLFHPWMSVAVLDVNAECMLIAVVFVISGVDLLHIHPT